MKKGLLLYMLFWAGMAYAQGTHQHIQPPLISGAEHPEKVPESAAWLAQLIASTSSERDDANTQAHAAFHRQRMGLGDVGATLEDFRTEFDWIIAHEMGMEARHDVAVLAANTVGKIKARLSEPEWEKVSEGVMGEREHIAFHDESSTESAQLKKPHFQNVQFIIPFSQVYGDQGYSQYVSIDGAPNAGVFYVTVYVYGNTNQTWMQGIGATHSFYIANQWDGNGVYSQSYGAQNPAQYVSFSNTITAPWDTLQHKVSNGAKIVCSIVGTFFGFVYSFLTAAGSSWFQYAGTAPDFSHCNVLATCTNPRPWIVDGTVVYVGPMRGCVPGYRCYGVCTRNPYTLAWTCPVPNTFMEACVWLSSNPGPQVCTPHP